MTRIAAALPGSVKKGESHINAGTLFPHEIVNKYRSAYNVDDTLEALWSNLPDTVSGCGNTMVVMDDSGSMEWVNLPGRHCPPLGGGERLGNLFCRAFLWSVQGSVYELF